MLRRHALLRTGARMTENPYQSPQAAADAVEILVESREYLRSVARSQKGILFCILIYLIAMFGVFWLPNEMLSVISVIVLLVGIVGALFVFMLAIKLYGAVLGIMLGVLSLVPLAGLLILSIVNGKATGVLRKNGVKVGLLGADISAI